VGEADVGWEGSVGLLVRQVVTDVGEEDALGAQFFSDPDRIVDGGMRGVGL